jgi:putative FmdB family regulatory protein
LLAVHAYNRCSEKSPRVTVVREEPVMPTYDYRCEACGHEFETFQSISANPLKKCPQCNKMQLRRLIGAGAGIIFKGSGFYETDYRSKDYKEKAKAEQGGSSDGGGSSDSSNNNSGDSSNSSSSSDSTASSSSSSSDSNGSSKES